MSLRAVRLGSPRLAGEGLRLGTVRRPPRGVPKAAHASGNWYDVWLPALAPSAALLTLAPRIADDDKVWAQFARRYRREMAAPDPRQVIALLAALSRTADFSIGCYCENPARCHRSLLQRLLVEAGAQLAD